MCILNSFATTETNRIFPFIICPGSNFNGRKRRDELQHNVFLMLEETNKFREHQSRELLIEILEEQNKEREKLIKELEDKIKLTDELLSNESSSNAVSMDESS